ncbi:MAG: hypothetical protein F4Z28_12940, partial [Gammaproteobacteria bacterium]|nr:hypothetical protein [Gammaproteobacteria bacterium]
MMARPLSVTREAISSIASTSGSSPVISMSIHTRTSGLSIDRAAQVQGVKNSGACQYRQPRIIRALHQPPPPMEPSVITAVELADRLAAPGHDVRALLVAQVTSPGAYAAGHVPGAVHIAPADLVSGIPPATGRLPDAGALTTLFRRIGYTHDMEVISLDDEGGGWAGRLAWTLDIIGNPRWRYLDGGLRAWAAAGLPLDRAPFCVPPSAVEISVYTGPIA